MSPEGRRRVYGDRVSMTTNRTRRALRWTTFDLALAILLATIVVLALIAARPRPPASVAAPAAPTNLRAE